MLIGEYESKVGDKNRIAVPKQFREELKEKIVITRGYERCLILVDEKRWRSLLKSIEVRPLLDSSVRDLKRYLVGGANEVHLDNQGRFVLNNLHKEFAGFKESLVFVGIEDWIEIWDKETWVEKIEG
ncbi:MAG TPA: division/cell wall cluster transcriptional repressor MraZ, partial [Candidatus Dojkabacteria bacterium]